MAFRSTSDRGWISFAMLDCRPYPTVPWGIPFLRCLSSDASYSTESWRSRLRAISNGDTRPPCRRTGKSSDAKRILYRGGARRTRKFTFLLQRSSIIDETSEAGYVELIPAPQTSGDQRCSMCIEPKGTVEARNVRGQIMQVGLWDMWFSCS